MSIDAWANAARQSQYRSFEAENQRAIDTLKAVFEGKEDPNRAASTIASIYNPLIQRAQIFAVTELWVIICEATQALGSDREIDTRLISLLNSVAALPDVVDKNGDPINAGRDWNYRVYWKDLPILAIIFREYGIDIEPGTPEMPDDEDWTEAQRATLLNVITFGALYLAHGQKDIGMSFHAEVSLLEGVEVPYQTTKQQRSAPTVVPPAATWIILAGKKIYGLCKIGKENQRRGFSLGRWALWKTRFGEIATNQGFKKDLRESASKAVSAMSQIEA